MAFVDSAVFSPSKAHKLSSEELHMQNTLPASNTASRQKRSRKLKNVGMGNAVSQVLLEYLCGINRVCMDLNMPTRMY